MVARERPREWNFGVHKGERYGLSAAAWSDLAETCAVCLERKGHRSGVRLLVTIVGQPREEVTLRWAPITPQALRSHADPQEATERGAYLLAILAACELLGFQAVERSVKGTGFDWWVGEEREGGLFQKKARLEVSGIGRGGEQAIRSRLKQKLAQTEQSDGTLLAAYIVIVEFGRPQSRVAQRSMEARA